MSAKKSAVKRKVPTWQKPITNFFMCSNPKDKENLSNSEVSTHVEETLVSAPKKAKLSTTPPYEAEEKENNNSLSSSPPTSDSFVEGTPSSRSEEEIEENVEEVETENQAVEVDTENKDVEETENQAAEIMGTENKDVTIDKKTDVKDKKKKKRKLMVVLLGQIAIKRMKQLRASTVGIDL